MSLLGNASLVLNKITERSPVISSFLINGALFALVYTIFIPVYETNDDVALSMVSAGLGRGNVPSEYLIHMNVVIGLLLKNLNEISNTIPWYGLFMVFSLYLAFTLISYVFIKTIGFTKALIFYSAFFTIAGTIMLLNMEFTTVSIVVCSASYLYFFYVGYLDKSTPTSISTSIIKYFPTVGLAILSAMIRWKSFLLMTVISLPLFLIVFYVVRSDRRKLLGALLGLAMVVIFSFGLKSFHAAYYDRGEWKGVLEHIVLRGAFTDFHLADSTAENKEVFDKVGWSENDFQMFRWRFCANEQLYSTKNLKYIVANIHKHQSFSLVYVTSFFKIIFNDKRGRILLFASVAFIPFLVFNSRPLVLVSGTFALIIGVSVYMAAFMKMPPPWVFLGILFHLFLLSYFCSINILTGNNGTLARMSHLIKKILIAIAAALLVVTTYASLDLSWQRTALAERRNAELENLIRQLNPRKDQLYVIWGPSFPYEYINPFKNLFLFSNFNSLGIGNFLSTPISKEILLRSDIDDIYIGLLRPDVFMFISSEHLNFLELYMTYMREHYNISVGYKVVSKNGPYLVFQFEKALPELSE